MRTAFIGLGVFGYLMAGPSARAGHQLVIYDSTCEKAAHWATEFSGRPAASPAEADTEVVMGCVGRDDDVRAITWGTDSTLMTQGKTAVFIDHTTASAVSARGLAQVAENGGFGFVDATVFGGEQGAKSGQLMVMLIEALAVGLNFARAAGLDLQAVVDVISKRAARSRQMDNRHKSMLAGHYEHGFAV